MSFRARPAGLLLWAALATTAWAQSPRFDTVDSIDWSAGRFSSTVRVDLSSAKLKMPTGRTQAEEDTDRTFPDLVRPVLYRLPVDSSSDIEDQIDQGVLSAAEVEAVIEGAQDSPSTLSPDLLTLSRTYTVALRDLAGPLIRHRRAIEPPTVMEPRATRPYTGIVIYADESLPVRGTRETAPASACLFPKVWDTGMNLVYERNMMTPEDAKTRGILRYASRGTLDAQADLVGTDPLRILARELFGTRATDPVIDRDDALKILSSPENRRLLTEGRIVIVLSEPALRTLP